MALPKIATPKYEMTLPSTGEKVSYRPFLVKEEKLLLMAMESGKQKEVIRTVKNLIQNCTDGTLKVDTLPMFDVEYLFLQLRIKSVEDTVELNLKCEKCGEPIKMKLDLKKVNVVFPKKKVDFTVSLTSDIGVKMKYPTLDMMAEMKPGDETKPEFIFDTISKCIESVYDGEQVYNDFTKKELDEFIDSLPQEHFKKVTEFFESMPKLKHDIEWTCPKDGHKNKIELSGLNDFFGSPSLT